ncbi:hypothetical protein [Nonomuraea sp. NPDC049141]|uniref:hypothetical protein n=1 Tax=unclassified Nonomuraea TaxID=2593643 RepID=UPI0033D63E96
MTLMAATPDLAAASPVQNTLKTAAQRAEGPLLADAVAMLPVATERREGYQRTSFRHWACSASGRTWWSRCRPDRTAIDLEALQAVLRAGSPPPPSSASRPAT